MPVHANSRSWKQRAADPVYKNGMARPRRLVVLTALGMWVSIAAAQAHHSFAAEYDGQRPVTMTGTVTKVEWTNPHVRFFMDVTDAAGSVTAWEFTMGAVNGLLRRGWTTTVLSAGDVVTVNGYLARDGSHLANARVVTLRDGRTMSGGTAPDAPGR